MRRLLLTDRMIFFGDQGADAAYMKPKGPYSRSQLLEMIVYFCKAIVLFAASFIAFSGCTEARTFTTADVKGPWYMDQGKYREGIAVLERELETDPESVAAAYWLGRYHLALNQPEAATPLLEQAVRLAPRDAEAHYWLGVSYWAQGKSALERAQYRKVLALAPDHLGANLYLGHNHLDQEEWAQALAQYEHVLRAEPTQPDALFHRAVALLRLNRRSEAKHAWKTFLGRYPEGVMALAAVDRLNALGDFDFRHIQVGKHRIAIARIAFDHHNAVLPESGPVLDLIGEQLRADPDFKLHIIVYLEGRPEAAKRRGMAVRQAILSRVPEIDSGRLPLSWFGEAQKVEAGGQVWALGESVHFVTQFQ